MLGRLREFFRSLRDPETEQERLDKYLESKRITTTAELEYWMKEYDLRKRLYSRFISEGRLQEARWVWR